MYSKIKFLGHPIHPILVAFPIAFYTAALVAYGVYAWQGDALWFRIGFVANIAGVGTAVVAAVPGFVDWFFGIPQQLQAKNVGLIHLVLNVSALFLFALAGWFVWDQWTATVPDLKWAIPLALIGVVLTFTAGYFGYEMIQRHHVSVELTPEQQRFEPVDPARVQSETTYRHV